MKLEMDDFQELNIQNFHSLIENYEKLIKDLTNDLNYFKKEHEDQKCKITTLVKENESLSNQVKQLLENKPKEDSNGDAINNLKQQLDEVLNEKECTIKLWQTAVSTVDSLEEELKMYQSPNNMFIPKGQYTKMKMTYESKIQQLQKEVESLNVKLEEMQKATTQELTKKYATVEQAVENQVSVLTIIEKLEEEISILQERLVKSAEIRSEMEKRLQTKEDFIKIINNKNVEFRRKVEEAVEIIEAALKEKDAALIREKSVLEEKEKIALLLSDIEAETQNKIMSEVLKVKNESNEKLQSTLNELKNTQNELNGKHKEIEDLKKTIKQLENQIHILQKGNLHIDDSNTSKLLMLEKNLESTFQKLLLSEKSNIQLNAQMECLKNDMEQMSQQYENALKCKDIEKATLENKYQQSLQKINEYNLLVASKDESIRELNNKITEIGKEKQQLNEFQEKLNDEYKEKLYNFESTYQEKVINLETQLDKEIVLNKKWRNEAKRIADEFAKVVFKMKKQLKKKRKENNELTLRVNDFMIKIDHYKNFLKSITSEVSQISTLGIEHCDLLKKLDSYS